MLDNLSASAMLVINSLVLPLAYFHKELFEFANYFRSKQLERQYSPLSILIPVPIMAPNRGPPSKTGKGKSSVKSKGPSKPGALGTSTKNRISKRPKAPPPKQQKTKSSTGPVRKKKKVYTDKELGLPKLNMITPVGVEKPKGKKKGKIFIDDQVNGLNLGAMS